MFCFLCLVFFPFSYGFWVDNCSIVVRLSGESIYSRYI